MDKIYIKNLEFIGYHGVFLEEKKLGQKFLISLELSLNTRKAGKSDDLTKSVHYGLIAKDVEILFLKKSVDLLETCAENIAELILSKYPLIKEVKVTIKKPWAPLQMNFEYVAVEIIRKRHIIYLSLGSNIGNKVENLNKAISMISSLPHTKILKTSKFLVTKPFGYLEQEDFLNCCLKIETVLSAEEFLEDILDIEIKMGRVREIKWGPRLIDIDILFFDNEIIQADNLAVPHPWICEREFVLEPLLEIAPNLVHPLENKTISVLYRKLIQNKDKN